LVSPKIEAESAAARINNEPISLKPLLSSETVFPELSSFSSDSERFNPRRLRLFLIL
jgi:hypothetical protein